MNQAKPMTTIESNMASEAMESLKIRNPVDIQSVLKDITQRELALQLFTPSGDLVMNTRILKLDPINNRYLLQVPNPDTFKQADYPAMDLIAVCFMNSVKIQFEAQQAKFALYGNQPVYVCQEPEWLLRLQRRNYYRVQLEDGLSIGIVIPLHNQTMVTAEVTDISIGGCAIVSDDDALAACAAGLLLKDCELSLPGLKPVYVDLEVRTSRYGDADTGYRLGCRFSELTGAQATLLQRFVMHAERTQRAKKAGLE